VPYWYTGGTDMEDNSEKAGMNQMMSSEKRVIQMMGVWENRRCQS
jgi:hypothetical protein